MSDSQGTQHTAATILKNLGQLTGMVHEQANRLFTVETRLANNEERLLMMLQSLPTEIRKHQFAMVFIGASVGSFVGVVAGILLVRGLLH